jgi:hypothetical protein
MPKGRPARYSVAKFPIASATAPASKGQGPCSKRFQPWRALFAPLMSVPCLRFSIRMVKPAMAAHRRRLSASAGARGGRSVDGGTRR